MAHYENPTQKNDIKRHGTGKTTSFDYHKFVILVESTV